MAQKDVQVTIGAKDEASGKLKSIAGSLKGLFALEALKKGIELLKQVGQVSGENDKALKASLSTMGAQFKGFQLAIGKAIFGNKELMGNLSALATNVLPYVVRGFEVVVSLINGFVKIIVQAVKSIGSFASVVSKVLHGDFKGAWETAKASISDTVGVLKDAGKGVIDNFKRPIEQIKPVMDKASTSTGALKEKVDELAEAIKKIPDEVKKTTDSIASLFKLGKGTQDDKNQLLFFRQGIVNKLKNKDLSPEERAALYEQLDKIDEALKEGAKKLTPVKVKTELEAPKFDPSKIDTSAIGPEAQKWAAEFNKKAKIADALKPPTPEEESQQTMLAFLDNSASGWLNMWDAIGRGENVFKALGASVKATIANMAKLEAQFAIGKALSALADGLLFGKPNAFGAAAKYFAAAAAFGLVGGIASSGGGGNGNGSSSDFASGRDNGTFATPTVYIQGSNFLDLGDPRQMDSLTKAINSLTGRRVNVVTT